MYKVAIVEDEELERRALKAILSRNIEGLSIVGEARNGTEATKLLDNHALDLMLVDINIPKPNGLEIIQMVRERQLNTKVIILTAYDHFEIMQKAIRLKADNYLLKPIRTPDLLKAVKECLADFGSHRTNCEIADKILIMMEHNAYRDCLALVRHHIEWIYARKEEAPRQAILDFSSEMLSLAKQRNMSIPTQLHQQFEALQKEKLDARSRNRILDLFAQMTDLLFAVSEDHFGSSSERMQNVLNFIERNLSHDISLEDAAECAHVSPTYFSRLFKKNMQETFVSYVKRRRMERAKELLAESDLPITNIALDLSFQDTNYFSKVFRKEVGMSPTEYRRDHK